MTSPKKLTVSATTTLGSTAIFGIAVNKTLTGTLTITDGATAVASFAVGTLPGTYHNITSGISYTNFVAVLSAADDVTVFSTAY